MSETATAAPTLELLNDIVQSSQFQNRSKSPLNGGRLLLGFDGGLDPAGEGVAVLARAADRQREKDLSEAVTFEGVEDRHPRCAVARRLEVVAAVRDRDRVLRQLAPADLRRLLELRQLELARGRHASVLDGAGVDGACAGGTVRRLADLVYPRAELAVVFTVGEEGEDLVDGALDCCCCRPTVHGGDPLRFGMPPLNSTGVPRVSASRCRDPRGSRRAARAARGRARVRPRPGCSLVARRCRRRSARRPPMAAPTRPRAQARLARSPPP